MFYNLTEQSDLIQATGLLLSKKMIIFDLDGTLAESKSDLDEEMADLLCRLLSKKYVAVMGGGNFGQFEKQFLGFLKCSSEKLKNLFILPTSGGRMYRYEKDGWELVYENSLTLEEKALAIESLKKAFTEIGYTMPETAYGEIIEDRGSQITFSALGQQAPLEKKTEWNEKHDIRPQLKGAFEKYTPELEVKLGGLTSLDITKKGIDKAYGLRQISKVCSIGIGDMVYIGDALSSGKNDSTVLQTGINAIQVVSSKETRKLIKKAIFSNSGL